MGSARDTVATGRFQEKLYTKGTLIHGGTAPSVPARHPHPASELWRRMREGGRGQAADQVLGKKDAGK